MLYADFNGLFGDILCLSHGDECDTEFGDRVRLKEGMVVTAYDDDEDDNGNRDRLIATGSVIPSPPDHACRGSVWSLKIDDNGVRHESDIKE